MQEIEGSALQEQPDQEAQPTGERTYDDLFVDDGQEDARTVEDAAVRPQEPTVSPPTAEDLAAIDAKLRERVPQRPLTAQEVAARRGQMPTDEDLAGINAARARGLHLS